MRRSLLGSASLSPWSHSVANLPSDLIGLPATSILLKPRESNRLPGFIGDTRCLINDHQHVPRMVATRSLNGQRGKPERHPNLAGLSLSPEKT